MLSGTEIGGNVHGLLAAENSPYLVISDITVDEYLNTPSELMWSHFVKKLGKSYEMWERFPKNFEDN